MTSSPAYHASMPQIAMWDWIHSVPEEICRSQNLSFSSQAEQLHHTTFDELHEYALKGAKAAYESLPHHLLLRFERVDPDTLALFSKKADVNESRLLLGLSKRSYRGEFIPAYAYMGRKNQAHQILLKLGHDNLSVKHFDGVEWEKPFDSIYDAYGQTNRAGDRICMMAAFYFLAANLVPEITTRTDNFIQQFTTLCSNIYLPKADGKGKREITTRELVGRPHKDQALPSHPLGRSLNEQERTPDLPLLISQQPEMSQKQESENEAFTARQGTSNAQLISFAYQIDENGDRSPVTPSNDNSPRVSSPTVWDSSTGPQVPQLPRSNTDLLIDLASPKGKPQAKPHDREATEQPVVPESKALNIDDLASFVAKFKELEAENAQHKRNEINFSNKSEKQLQDLQQQFLDQEKELREELARSKTESAASCQLVNQRLLQELENSQLVRHEHGRMQAELEAIQAKLETLQSENKRLKKRFAEEELNGASRQKLAAMEANWKAFEVNKKDRIRILEAEVQMEKNKFNDYKRKIRNLSLDP